MNRRSVSIERGFAVPMAAAIGIIVAMLVAGALEFVRVQAQDLAILRAWAEALAPLRSTMNLIVLLLKASARDGAGMTPDAVAVRRLLGLNANRIYFDGTPFDVITLNRRIRVRIQDEAGLASINGLTVEEIEKFLVSAGVPAETAARFAAEAVDFRDFDNDRLQNGAEQEDYVRQGLKPPKNRAFNHSGELGLLFSAERLQKDIPAELITQFGFDQSGKINVNAASASFLTAAFGFSGTSAEKLIQDRKQRQIYASDIIAYTHRQNSFLQTRSSYGSSNRFRISLSDIDSGAALRRGIVIDPSAGANNPITGPSAQGVETVRRVEQETIDLPP
jgi:type II secretory pathway component PulK